MNLISIFICIIQIRYLMGNAFDICKQDGHKASQIFDDLEQINDVKHYKIDDINHTDNQLLEEINSLKQQANFQQFTQNKMLMKHTDKDEYYLGDWQNNVKKGKGISYSKGEYLYYGQFDKVPNGTGRLKLYKQNIVIEGQIKHGMPEGLCKIQDLNGVYTFEGIINDKHLPNNGKFQIKNEEHPQKSYTIILQDYPNNKARINFNDGTQYLGQISYESLLPSGYGEANYSNQSKYLGNWQNGQYHGQGRFIWSDGSSYSGNYEKGIKKGQGRYEYVSKKYYEGEWANGKQQGKGVLYSPNGQILKEGFWLNGLYQKQQDSHVNQQKKHENNSNDA